MIWRRLLALARHESRHPPEGYRFRPHRAPQPAVGGNRALCEVILCARSACSGPRPELTACTPVGAAAARCRNPGLLRHEGTECDRACPRCGSQPSLVPLRPRLGSGRLRALRELRSHPLGPRRGACDPAKARRSGFHRRAAARPGASARRAEILGRGETPRRERVATPAR